MKPKEYQPKDVVKASHWQRHLDQWEKSGQAQNSYCQEHGLKLHSFHYWRKKLNMAPKSSRLRRVPLAIPSKEACAKTNLAVTGRRLQVVVGNLRLEVDESIDPIVLTELVKALVVVPCGV